MIELNPHTKEYYIDNSENLKVIAIPCRADNYTYLVLSDDEKKAILIDCADHIKTLEILDQLNINLKAILITHHHHDHVDGIDKIASIHAEAQIYCSQKEQDRKIFKTSAKTVFGGDKLEFFNDEVQVLETPGHTSSLTTYYFKNSNLLFCGDHLFSLGCGRVFEHYPGVFSDFFNSMKKVISFTNDKTKIFCAHEYTKKNLTFLDSIGKVEGDLLSELKERINTLDGTRSVPTNMEFEKKYNVFLNAKNVEEFKKNRELKDNF